MIEDEDYFDSAAQGLRPFSDFEWFAIDSNGHIAFLTSAEFAAIPLVVFRSKEQYLGCVNYFENLSEQSDYTLRQDVSYKLTSWINAAKCGLFAYDWDCGLGWYETGKPYRLLVSPNKPLIFSELPSEVQEYLLPIRFTSVNFADAKELFLETKFPDNNWSMLDRNPKNEDTS
ncbi:MAG: hypothetical protein ABI891_00345 [Acidobacteriota bacterium]